MKDVFYSHYTQCTQVCCCKPLKGKEPRRNRCQESRYEQKTKMTRREVLRAGAGVAGGVLATTAAAGSLTPTAANPEGLFYLIHEQTDRDMDLTRVEGREG